MSSSNDNSFAQILGRHAAGAGDSGSSGASGSSGTSRSPTPRAQAAAGKDQTEGKSNTPEESTPAKKRRTRTKTRKAATGGGSGRRGGKRSDPDYTHVTVLLHKDLIRRLKMAKVLQERDMSDIVAEALDKELGPE